MKKRYNLYGFVLLYMLCSIIMPHVTFFMVLWFMLISICFETAWLLFWAGYGTKIKLWWIVFKHKHSIKRRNKAEMAKFVGGIIVMKQNESPEAFNERMKQARINVKARQTPQSTAHINFAPEWMAALIYRARKQG